MKFLLLAATVFALGTSAQAANLPFVGKWDCEGNEMTFTSKMYNDGSTKRRITEAQEGSDGSYAVFVDDDTYVTVSDFTARSMVWTASDDSGLQLQCDRLGN